MRGSKRTLLFFCIIVRCISNYNNGSGATYLPILFCCFWDFSFSTYGPTPVRRTTWPRYHDLWLWRSWRYPWCGSLCPNCVPSFNFVGLLSRKIWYTSDLSISRPGDFDLWPWNWCALLEWAIFLPILVFLWLFALDVSANTCQTHHVTLRPWHLTLEVTALVGDADLRPPSMYKFVVRRPSLSEDITSHLLREH